MRALVIDDEGGMRRAVENILREQGCEIRICGTLQEAVSSAVDFRPDIVFLDTVLQGESSLGFIEQVRKTHPDVKLKVILLASIAEEIPTDIPEVKGCVRKPFDTEHLLSALYSVSSSSPAAAEQSGRKQKKAEPKKPKPSGGFSFFRRKKIPDPIRENPSEHGVRFGLSYIVFETAPEKIYEFAKMFDPESYSVLVITSGKTKTVRDELGYGKIDVKAMVPKPKEDGFSSQGYGTLISELHGFICESTNPVVVFDNFNEMVKVNGMGKTLRMIDLLLKRTDGIERTLAISVDENSISKNDRRVLMRGMNEYKD